MRFPELSAKSARSDPQFLFQTMNRNTMRLSAAPRTRRLDFTCARIVHITMPPHEPDGYTSTSEPFAIGISYTGHRKAVIGDGTSASREISFAPGTCGINGADRTRWLRVAEPSEALEIQPSQLERQSTARAFGIDWTGGREFLQLDFDPVLWGICARFRMAACGAAVLSELHASALVHDLLFHVASHYFGVHIPKTIRGRLDARRLARVTALVEDSLQNPPNLRTMADAAAMSPFHFQRLFRATTGLTPHQYVNTRRMERARRMLSETGAKVAHVAAELGFSDLAHFRRTFRRQFNQTPRGN